MNQEQIEAEMQIAPKETQVEFAAALTGYIMIGIAHAKEMGKSKFDIDATLPMMNMVKRALDGKLRVVEIKTATDIMTESVKSGMFDTKPKSAKVEV